ncbi:MAG: ATP-dependent helicase RecG [Verrucomicrobiales bacterium]|nr:ATP-dependent helicase RecG [Verrucomicrobiales bacterium]
MSKQPLTFLRGVGPERAAQLARLKVFTLEDLIFLRPRRYEDRRHVRQIADLQRGEAATVRGKIVAAGIKRFARRTKSVFEFIIDDGTARLHCRWWNMPYMEGAFCKGDDVLVYGKVKDLKPRIMDHPESEIVDSESQDESVHLNRIAPIYPLTEGLAQRWLRALIWNSIEGVLTAMAEPWGGAISNPSQAEALRTLHFPENIRDIEIARQRLALDEFIELQVAIRARRRKLCANATALPCRGDNHLIKPFLAALPFKLTGAQTKVLREIREDMSEGEPMRRLLQGDVGSGKTVVAACTALMVLESGHNVVLIAPTQILAEQHFNTFERWFKTLAVDVELCRAGQRTSMSTTPTISALNRRITVGTHALLEDNITLERLGLVVIDEQHKFGVAQRETLVRKGRYPHLLVMTATPIPRTLGLTLYGDLDVSTIGEKPAERGLLKTFLRAESDLPKVWEFLRKQLAQGRQAYVVYPRVDETDEGDLKSVLTECRKLEKLLKPHTTGFIHGKMKAVEKEASMTRFRDGSLKVLVASSLIEVGVDVANATVMIIENAERFGLSQLHQLRGRIGRGTHESYCILIAKAKTDDARRRLSILQESNDGFRIAEVDLEIRGPGELLGQSQSGLPPLKFGDLRTDLRIIEKSRELAAQFESH